MSAVGERIGQYQIQSPEVRREGGESRSRFLPDGRSLVST
jgi:hypothetical protein